MQNTRTTIGLKHLDHLNLSVTNLEETCSFYQRVFEMKVVEEGIYEGHPWAILRGGDAMLCVYEHPERVRYGSDERAERRIHGLSHMALRITDGEAWEARVALEGVTVRYGDVVRWPHSRSWYVDDPTGYGIEVVLWNDDTVRFE